MESVQSTVAEILESIQNLETFANEQDSANGISLLELKNEALLSYIANLLIISASQIEQNDEIFSSSRERAIEQRVTLEKGVRGLEAKIAYQVNKALRAYRRSQEEGEEGNASVKPRKQAAAPEESDSDSDFDPATYRPNVSSLKTQAADEDSDDNRTYVAPKISADMPTTEQRSEKPRDNRRRRDFAMEEYIRESGDAPIAEASIGSQIMDYGRGGERTSRERQKDLEIQNYEESNFTRISGTSSKRARKEAAQRQRDATTNKFFGEDWSFLDDSRKRRKK